MKTAQSIAEEAIDKLEEEELVASVDTKKTEDVVVDKPEIKEDDKKVEEPVKPKYDKDGNRLTEEPKEDEPEKKEEEGDEFTADDDIKVEEAPAPERPTDAAGVQLSPAESKFIVDNIGEPMVIRGMQGEKEVELKVYSPDQIPQNFKFTSDASLLAAQNGFSRMENRAQQLLGNFRNEQSATQAQDFEARENEGIRTDIAELQKDGEFPKFKVQPGTAGFEDDPSAQQVTDVLAIMTDRNEQYLKEYQQGRPYRHIGFREAFEVYKNKQPAAKKDAAQKAEDSERKQVADKIGDNRGLSQDKLQKATVRPGTNIEDILNRYEAEGL